MASRGDVDAVTGQPVNWFAANAPTSAPSAAGGNVVTIGNWTGDPTKYDPNNPMPADITVAQINAALPGASAGFLQTSGDANSGSGPRVTRTGNPQTDWQDFLGKLNPSSVQTNQVGLQAIVDRFNAAYGYSAKATGADTVDFGMPGYSSMDVLSSGNRWQWTVDDPNGGGSNANLSALSGMVGPGTFTPSAPAFQPTPFVAPTGVDMTNDPGYQFRIDQARKGSEASAASKGTLLTMGHQADLTDLIGNQASQEYANVFGRALQTNQTNNSTGLAANQNAFSQDLSTYGTRYDALYKMASLGYDATKSSYA